jgi:hypothetical protein
MKVRRCRCYRHKVRRVAGSLRGRAQSGKGLKLQRTVHHAEALAWLAAEAGAARPGTSVVTSLPDVSEVGMPLDAWRGWFVRAARACVEAAADDGVAIFFQTDIKKGGVWIDKSHLVARGAEEAGAQLLWKKVVLRKPAGTITFGRPAYTHVLCVSRALRPREPSGIPDVLDEKSAGKLVWTRGMGVNACARAVRFVKEHTQSTTILDPFCGHGTVLAVANALGLDAIGVELNRKRAVRARTLAISLAP